jgi:hypothetical protein
MQSQWLQLSPGLIDWVTQSTPTTGVANEGDLSPPAVGMAAMPRGNGYWLVNAAGVVSPHGAAVSYGSLAGLSLNAPIAHIVATTDGGYWLVAADGGIFSFGDATFFGSMGGTAINAPIVGMAVDNTTYGYWLLGSDGGIFSFGAPYFGSN